MSDLATGSTLAHELGHILGMDDIYARRKGSQEILMVGYGDLVYPDMFEDRIRDWSGEDRRGFYEADDTHGILVERLLMHGMDLSDWGIVSIDIPSGSVRGYPERPRHSFDKPFVRVGADSATKEEFR